jgi:hypothetical protein
LLFRLYQGDEMIFDSHGLIVQQDGDGGDTFARHYGMRFIKLVLARNNMPLPKWIFPQEVGADVKLIGPRMDGMCVRHPDQGPQDRPWNGISNFSRDQRIPGVLFFGVLRRTYGDSNTLLHAMWEGRKKSSFIEQNGDILWNTFSQWIRAFGKNMWLCYITDVCIFVDTLIRCGYLPRHKHDYEFPDGTRGSKFLWGPDRDDVGDDMNLFLVLTQAANVYDTFWTRFCRWLYERKRPESFGNTILGEKNKMLGALMWYCRFDPEGKIGKVNHGNPDWAETCRPITEKWFT